MPVYHIRHQGLECYLKTDVGFLAPNWFLSIRTPERLARTYGLFDPVTVELRLCMDVQHIAC